MKLNHRSRTKSFSARMNATDWHKFTILSDHGRIVADLNAANLMTSLDPK